MALLETPETSDSTRYRPMHLGRTRGTPSGSRQKLRREGDDALKNELPIVYLARHSETTWTLSGQHTGLTDLPLTEHGERSAQRLGKRLQGLTFAKVFTSPLQRARQTCELAGFGPVAEIDRDLVEWDYGKYEGRRGAEIRAERPDWNLFRDGCPRRRDASASQRSCGPRR